MTTQLTAQALAAASISFPDIISHLTRAVDNPAARTLFFVKAQSELFKLADTIHAAMEEATAENPAPTVEQIRGAALDESPDFHFASAGHGRVR